MLIKAVEGMTPDYAFTIILYDHRVWTWRDQMVPGNAANRRDAVAWVRDQPDSSTWGLTNIFDAFARAFELTTGEASRTGRGRDGVFTDPGDEDVEFALDGAEEIRFLTDGEPTDGRTSTRRTSWPGFAS